jgi:predicted metal-dependent phosphoesterase TrpH
MTRGDLHIHTTASDGVLSPAEVAQHIARERFRFFAITDHNTLAGLGEGARAAADLGLVMIVGVELSAQPADADEIHILGYGFDPGAPGIGEVCREITRRKNEQMWSIVDRLRRAGVGIDTDELPDDAESGYVGRPVLADMLVEGGVVSSPRQAFARFLGSGGDAYVPMRDFSPVWCIDAVHAAGGLAVLAHPTISTVDAWIQPLSDAGLDGIEACRPALTGNQQLYIEKAAEHFGLFITGGSDSHGRQTQTPIGSFSITAGQAGHFFAALGLRLQDDRQVSRSGPVDGVRGPG